MRGRRQVQRCVCVHENNLQPHRRSWITRKQVLKKKNTLRCPDEKICSCKMIFYIISIEITPAACCGEMTTVTTE
ncbi:hypothetical protein INR49_014196 [Caranx melampygus]|nr:hypothetical protein INR49_014196 [Caranx melampygus]